MLGGLYGRFVACDEVLALQQIIDGLEALEVHIHIDSTEPVQKAVSNGVGPLNVVAEGVVDGQELRIVILNQTAVVVICLWWMIFGIISAEAHVLYGVAKAIEPEYELAYQGLEIATINVSV
jgi:uncharacterized membrane protein YccF (DUF307 family)